MTIMNILYGVDAASQDPQQSLPPIQINGAHLSRLHQAMISLCVGQIMERPLAEREVLILNAPITADLKVIFLETLERVTARCKEIEKELDHKKFMVLPLDRTLALFDEMRCLHVESILMPIIAAIPERKRYTFRYSRYLEIMAMNSQDKVLYEMKRQWFSSDMFSLDEFERFISENVDIPRIIIHFEVNDLAAKSLVEGLKSKTSLQRLKINNNNRSSAPDDILIFLSGLQCNTSLKSLDMSGYPFGDKGAEELAGLLKIHPSLETLRLWSNKISDVGAKEIAEALKDNRVLKKIRLTFNLFADKGAAHFARALNVNQSLRSINLKYCEITDDGVKVLADALLENRTLLTLILNNNKISSIGAVDLANALKQNRSLTNLNLWGNEIQDEGAEALADMLKVNRTLTTLILEYNVIKEGGKSKLQEVKDMYPERRIDFYQQLDKLVN